MKRCCEYTHNTKCWVIVRSLGMYATFQQEQGALYEKVLGLAQGSIWG